MVIGGLQKLTLLDYPGKVACTVFLPGCNFRCPYCHNSCLVIPEKINAGFSEEELFSFLLKRRGKLDGVCITGGEPTIHRELPELIRKIKDLGFLVKLDTNGSNPQMLKELLEENLLDFVAMDIKNAPSLYKSTCGNLDFFEKIRESRDLLMERAPGYEFRTTVCKPFHSPESMEALGQWIRGAEKYYLQNFEDSGDLIGTGMTGFSREELQNLLTIVRAYVPEAQIRGQ